MFTTEEIESVLRNSSSITKLFIVTEVIFRLMQANLRPDIIKWSKDGTMIETAKCKGLEDNFFGTYLLGTHDFEEFQLLMKSMNFIMRTQECF